MALALLASERLRLRLRPLDLVQFEAPLEGLCLMDLAWGLLGGSWSTGCGYSGI